jgi:hypothetical protein
METGVEEVIQDPHPLVVEGAVRGVTAGAAVGATGMSDSAHKLHFVPYSWHVS